MVVSWIILRVSTVLLIILYPSLCLSKCTAEHEKIACINTNSDDYAYEINKLGLQSMKSINISNSYMPIVSDFLDDILNSDSTIFNYIYINHCNVKEVDNHAFGPLVRNIDLSFNNIENMTFVSFLKPGWSVNLSHNRIKNISFICDYWTVKNVLSDLDLSYNEIEFVEEDIHWLPLNRLDLSHNKLIRFYFGKNLTSSSINLAYNNDLERLKFPVSYSYSVLELNLTNSIGRLSDYSVALKKTRGSLIISNTIMGSFKGKIEADSLYMSNCSLKTAMTYLGPYKSKVDLSHNALTSFNPNYPYQFKGDIDDLDLSYNYLNSTKQLFTVMPRKIDLSHNKLITLVSTDVLTRATHMNLSSNHNLKLSNYSLWDIRRLWVLDISFCNITEIPDKLFLHSNRLRELFLQNNQIHHLFEGIFQNLTSIELINLSSNRLTIIGGFVFSSIPVKMIDISNNNNCSIANNAFFNLSRFSIISMNNNELLQIENAAFNQLSIGQLNMQNCQLTKFNATVLNNTNIDSLNLSGNNLTGFEFPHDFQLSNLQLTFDGNLTRKFLKIETDLQTLTFYNSTIYMIESGAFIWLPNLREISFEKSKVINAEPGFLNGLFSLQKLDLKIFVQNISTLKNNTFEDMYSLQELDLSQLHIENIETGAFNGLQKIKHLNLSHNELSSIEILFENLSTLKTLDISFNKLKALPVGLYPHLKVEYHHNAIDLHKSRLQTETGNLKVLKDCSSICRKSQIDYAKFNF